MEKDKEQLSYHFVGIGGIGMSAIAQIIKARGHIISGSDRGYDNNPGRETFRKLENQGARLYSQDGSGINGTTDVVVISSAIESDNLDLKMAEQRNIQVIKRSELLSRLFNDKHGIAIGGSNGKTTVCGMISWLLDKSGHDPTVIGGGYFKNFITDNDLGNAKTGTSDKVVIEADESDGSLVSYTPKVSVITDISKDHKTVDELGILFGKFAENTAETVIINESCNGLVKVNGKSKTIIKYGEGKGADIKVSQVTCTASGSRFEVNGCGFEINVPGRYNVFNALAAIAVARTEGISDSEIHNALKTFKGVKRRMDVVGEKNGVKVIDDFAHNPKKVQAAIDAARLGCARVRAIFQPHGYASVKFLKKEFVSAFAETLLPDDVLFMPEIFYAGGTADKEVSSEGIVNDLKERGINAIFTNTREKIISELKRDIEPGDCIIVMGARDDSLTDFCHEILDSL